MLRLIQLGQFQDVQNGGLMLALPHCIDLKGMGSSEFEWGAIPNALARMFWNFKKYRIFNTDIFTPEGEELLIWVQKNQSEATIEAVKTFILAPYGLKERSQLELIPTAKQTDEGRKKRSINFWWCIDRNTGTGDWMGFLSSQKSVFLSAVKADYKQCWLTESKFQRQQRYLKAFQW